MLEVIILAAGKGTRMRSDLPKVLHPLAGQPLLAHVLDTARALQPTRIHVVVGHGAEQVRAALGETAVQFHEQVEQLGTGHAVAQALPHCDSESQVVVLFGDVPLLGADAIRPLVEATRTGPGLLAARLSDPTGYGRVLQDGQGRFLAVVEEKDATPDQRTVELVNTGVVAAPAAQLGRYLAAIDNDNAQGEYYLPDVLTLAVGEGTDVAVVITDDPSATMGVNDRLQLASLEREFQRRSAERLLLDGVALADPARLDIRGTLQCGRDVSIDVNVLFEGDVMLGDNVSIGANCVIKNAQIGARTLIQPFTHIDGARVGASCTVGPYARLRPDARLDRGVRVGNFVEIKKARLGEGSKANHLAYIGDAQVGAQSNIGAGTITCNYDGANKHLTTIGDGVFIGSNSTLVAPVAVDDGAFVGAGSVITKQVPPNQLAVGRAKQRNIDGWQAPIKAGSARPSSDANDQ